MTAPTLHQLDVTDIQILGRERKDLGSLVELGASIKANGQITPGVIRPTTVEDVDKYFADPDIPWILVAGERRFRAIIQAGLDSYIAIDKGELPEMEQRVLELEENLHRKEMTWDEQASARRKIHELRTEQAASEGRAWTLADTARELGESVATISRDVSVAKAIEADPTLKGAGSKKAAGRILEMRAHVERESANISRGTNQRVTELLVEDDARRWLRSIETGKVDAVITDLPYGGDFHSLGMKRKEGVVSASDYDDTEGVTKDLFVDIVPQLIRVTKEAGWIACFMSESNYGFLQDLFETCCTTHLSYGKITWLEQDSGDWEKKMPVYCENAMAADKTPAEPCNFLRAEVPRWIWYRPNSRNPARYPERHAKNFYENILVVNRGSGRLYKTQDYCPNVIPLASDYGEERIHSMQKPKHLGLELASRFTLAGELVIDPFFGSGALLAGAASIQRKVRGCEMNPLMVDQAQAFVGKHIGG